MTSIDGTRKAFDALNLRTHRMDSASPSRPVMDLPPSAASDSMSSSSTRERALSRIHVMARDDPDPGHKVIRTFVDGVLTAEFGTQAVSTADYQQMLSAVVEQITGDAELTRHFLQTIQRMASGQ